mgnify:CR=1 FL=1
MTHHRHHLGERNLRIGVKIWLFFMLFVCVVFLLMWLFQIIFLEWFYESMKIRDTAKLAQQLVSDYGSEDFSDDAQEISLQNEMCIELLNSNGREGYYNCVYNGKCLLHGKESGTLFYLIDLQNSSTGTICRRVSNPTLQNEMLVYGCTMYSKDDGSVLGYLLLNSPLVPVESTVSILKREQHLNIIIEETDRLTQIVNDMLDLSKLESGAQKLDYSTFDIAQCMAEIVHRYEGVSERMGYQIHLTLDEPCMVRCDESKIDRVIGNLINNAINYTSKEDKQVFVTQRNLPQCVRIEVRDTGDGIEEDKIKLIFDKYYRSENHKREVVGTGLGLSIVKEILKMHNYNYGVNSKLGEGSTFWFEIRDIVPPEKPEDEEIPDAEIRQL